MVPMDITVPSFPLICDAIYHGYFDQQHSENWIMEALCRLSKRHKPGILLTNFEVQVQFKKVYRLLSNDGRSLSLCSTNKKG